MEEEIIKPEKIESLKSTDKVSRAETIRSIEQNEEHTTALASNPDQFHSVADLRIANTDQIEPFQIVDSGKTIAASRKIEQEPLDSFNQGLLALPEGTTPEHLARYQIDYINRKAGSIEAASIMPAITQTRMLEGYVEKSQPNQENNEFYERMAGTLIGTVQGIGNIAVNLAYIADFCAYAIIGDRERGSEMLSNAGIAIADTALSGINLFHAADNYLFQVGFEGDYSKPFSDIASLAIVLNDRWQQLPPREQERRKAELTSQLIADGLVAMAGSQSIGKAKLFSELLDEIALEAAKETSQRSKKLLQFLANQVDDLLQPEIEIAGIGKMKMRDLKPVRKEDLALKMEGQHPSKAYRGDEDFRSKIDKLGYPKSHINDAGDLVPADINGLFKGRPVDIMEHICDVYFKEEKAHSPFTSLSISDESAMFFGNKKLKVDLVALRAEIKDGSLIGTELIEHLELLDLIEKSHFKPTYHKKTAKILVKEDKEMLVKGPIPARFLEISK